MSVWPADDHDLPDARFGEGGADTDGPWFERVLDAPDLDGVPAEHQALAHLLLATRAPATDRELAGEASAIALFRSVMDVDEHPRTGGRRASSALAVAATLTIATFAGAAAAAGRLPADVQDMTSEVLAKVGIHIPAADRPTDHDRSRVVDRSPSSVTATPNVPFEASHVSGPHVTDRTPAAIGRHDDDVGVAADAPGDLWSPTIAVDSPALDQPTAPATDVAGAVTDAAPPTSEPPRAATSAARADPPATGAVVAPPTPTDRPPTEPTDVVGDTNANSNGNANPNTNGNGNGNGNGNANGNGNGNAYGNQKGDAMPEPPDRPANAASNGHGNGNQKGDAMPELPDRPPANAGSNGNGNGNTTPGPPDSPPTHANASVPSSPQHGTADGTAGPTLAAVEQDGPQP
jgi:hypothetical protein